MDLYGRTAPDEPREETIYDLLRAIVERTGWRTEAEALRYRELLNRLEQVNLFGYLSQKVTTKEDGS
jgi:hypothetical protein